MLSMNILLLNAGAKNNGATQEILNVIQQEISQDHKISNLCLGDVNLKFCKGCLSCYQTCRCVLSDDMESIIAKINDADILVIAAPSYWADIPGQFKVFIDRCTPYSNTNPHLEHIPLKAGIKCYAIALRTGTRSVECEHILDTIQHWCGHMNINMVDSLYFCGITDRQDIEEHRALIAKKAKNWFK